MLATRTRTTGLATAAIVVCAAAAACGGAEQAAEEAAAARKMSAAAAAQQREIEYTKRCYSRSAQQEQAVKSGRYHPPRLYLHQWPKADKKRKLGSMVGEKVLGKSLGSGLIRHGLVIARGGAGKTSLAKALEVSLCADLRTFLVHLQWDVADVTGAKVGPGKKKVVGNPIVVAMARQLGALDGVAPLPFLKERIGKARPWLVLLDALDEVALDRRKQVVGWVNELQTSLPELRSVVFSRPPVFDATFGLKGLTATVEIPPLSCAEVDRAIVTGPGGTLAGQKFRKFLSDFRLGEKVGSGAGCYYPQMSTWRDLAALLHVGKLRDSPALAKRLNTTGIDGRAALFEAYLTILLQDDLQGTSMRPHDALLVIDSVVKAGATSGIRTLTVRLPQCMAAAPGNQAQKKTACETLLQSALFRRTNRKGIWRLANQTLSDLFIARRINAELPGDGECAPLKRHASLFESSEIGGFLLGMSRGRTCMVELTGIICMRSRHRQQELTEVARNLPPGVDGHKTIVAGLARAKQDARTPACAIDLLTRLERDLRPKTAKTGF